MAIIYLANSKKQIGWVREWALTIALLGGMAIAAVI